jgi:hypothetical protein
MISTYLQRIRRQFVRLPLRQLYATLPLTSAATPSLRLRALAQSESHGFVQPSTTYTTLTPSRSKTLAAFGKEEWLPEDDDSLHGDTGRCGKRIEPSRLIYESSAFRVGTHWSWRGLFNVGGVIFLLAAIVSFLSSAPSNRLIAVRLQVGVFAGYPVASVLMHLMSHASAVNTTSYPSGTPNPADSDTATSSISGSGASIVSDAPNMSTRALVDPDTPMSAYTKMGVDGVEPTLVFSDEFKVEGRTFYTGESARRNFAAVN